MRVIKLSHDDEEMGTHDEVLYFFTITLRSKGGRFGLTPAKAKMQGLEGTLLIFSYDTECMFLARADSEVIQPSHPYFRVALDSITPIAGNLSDFERALHAKGYRKNLVRTQSWPIVPDKLETFTKNYFARQKRQRKWGIQEQKSELFRAMLDLYHRAGDETGYWGNYYVRSLRKDGGLATARRMLQPRSAGELHAGLRSLIEAGRADELSVEAIALRPEFRSLFSKDELAEASRRLKRIPRSGRQQRVPPEKIFPETIQSGDYFEGRTRKVLINVYERDPKAREACIAHFGCRCAVCTMSFVEEYGELGEGFIHVHHKRPVAMRRREYSLNPKKDLVPVCPNCHAMLHATKPPLTIEQLKRKISPVAPLVTRRSTVASGLI